MDNRMRARARNPPSSFYIKKKDAVGTIHCVYTRIEEPLA